MLTHKENDPRNPRDTMNWPLDWSPWIHLCMALRLGSEFCCLFLASPAVYLLILFPV
jgi:hypothetical protein